MRIRRMRIALTVSVAGALFWGSACKKDGGNDDLLTFGALALLTRSGNQAAAQSRAAGSAVSSAVSTAAQSNSVGFWFHPIRRDRLIAELRRISREKALAKLMQPRIFPAATATGGTCNNTGCNATLNGDVDCPKGGKATLSNMKVGFTFANNGFTGTMSGSATLSKCANIAVDFVNYPKQQAVVANGTVTLDGTTGIQILSISGDTINLKFKDDQTLSSPDLSVNGGAPMSVAIKTINDVTVSEKQTNVTTSTSGNTFTFSADIEDTLTGSFSLSGTADGAPVSASRTWNSETFKFKIKCTMDLSGSGGSCDVL